MAQLNDLLVLGNTSLIGDVNANGKITAPEFIGSLTGTATNVPWSGVTSKPATSVSWSNRTLTVNAAGSSATGAIPTTLTGFSSITSTSLWGLLKR